MNVREIFDALKDADPMMETNVDCVVCSMSFATPIRFQAKNELSTEAALEEIMDSLDNIERVVRRLKK